MKRSGHQQGFSLIIGLVLVAVIAGLSIAGWYVWHKNKQDKTTDKTNTTSQTNQNQNKKQVQSADPSEGGKYLVIKEWGVRLPLGGDISEAYYKLESDADGQVDYVELYDAAFDKLKNANGTPCGGENVYQFYSISRIRKEDIAALGESAGSNHREFSFSREYLFGGLGAHQAPPVCANLNPDPYGELQDDTSILNIANTKEQAFDKAFDKAFDNLQKTN